MNYTNTNEMVYDINKHRYILTPESIASKYGIQLNEVLDSDGAISAEILPDLFLDRVSLITYNYIYSWCQNRDETEYVISLPKYRAGLEDAMAELAYGWLINNTDPSIFFNSDFKRGIELVPSAHIILLNNGLLFRGKYTAMPENWKETKGVDY